jgi:1,2-phenylacetyl-CoA epoxidase catalytic subunit
MDKLLPHERRTISDFEVIDVVSETAGRLRGQLDVDVPMQVRWNDWEYGSEVAELRALYEKGKRVQWNASVDLDWSTRVSKDEWIADPSASQLVAVLRIMGADEATQKAALFDELTYILSQLLHGEQAALQICGQLTNLCPTTDEKFYAAQQTADEARHLEVMARFLSEKLGTIYPINPVTKVLLDALLAAPGYYKKTLGMQTLFEGVAMAIFDGLEGALVNPLFKDIMHRVKIDEARHAAFGVLTMRRAVNELDDEGKAELEAWAFSILEALNANQQLDMLRTLGPKYGIDPERWLRKVLRWEHWGEMNSFLYMHTVVPNLERLGLITERTRDGYRTLGMLSSVRASVG